MSFRRKLKYLLVHRLRISNQAAEQLIANGDVSIDGNCVQENILIEGTEEIKVKAQLLQESKPLVYLRFYKPIGFESSLNPGVSNNLSAFFENYEDLAIAGRLDKQSHGLMLLSNDGKWIKKICHPDNQKEKEYLVELDRAPDEAFLESFRKGVDIGTHTTLTCECEFLEGKTIRVVLKEGKNRQIRRMCGVLKYKVISLKRIRIAEINLDQLQIGQSEMIPSTQIY